MNWSGSKVVVNLWNWHCKKAKQLKDSLLISGMPIALWDFGNQMVSSQEEDVPGAGDFTGLYKEMGRGIGRNCQVSLDPTLSLSLSCVHAELPQTQNI